jgi:hypothetical protein
MFVAYPGASVDDAAEGDDDFYLDIPAGLLQVSEKGGDGGRGYQENHVSSTGVLAGGLLQVGH